MNTNAKIVVSLRRVASAALFAAISEPVPGDKAKRQALTRPKRSLVALAPAFEGFPA